jgi:hypothetical protein
MTFFWGGVSRWEEREVSRDRKGRGRRMCPQQGRRRDENEGRLLFHFAFCSQSWVVVGEEVERESQEASTDMSCRDLL